MVCTSPLLGRCCTVAFQQAFHPQPPPLCSLPPLHCCFWLVRSSVSMVTDPFSPSGILWWLQEEEFRKTEPRFVIVSQSIVPSGSQSHNALSTVDCRCWNVCCSTSILPSPSPWQPGYVGFSLGDLSSPLSSSSLGQLVEAERCLVLNVSLSTQCGGVQSVPGSTAVLLCQAQHSRWCG